MSGHSKWATTKHKKAAIDAKRGKLFAKLIKNIEIAARQGGGDPDGNPSLYDAIYKAKKASMPADNIKRAVKRGSGEEAGGANYEDIVYEGYAPAGVGLIIECLTDNRNRAAAEVRSTLTKGNGSLATSGSVSFNFERKGQIVVPAEGVNFDDLFEKAAEAGAEDVTEDGEVFTVITGPSDLTEVRKALQDAGFDYDSADLVMAPKNEVELSLEDAQKVSKLIDNLDDLDDVQNIYSNSPIAGFRLFMWMWCVPHRMYPRICACSPSTTGSSRRSNGSRRMSCPSNACSRNRTTIPCSAPRRRRGWPCSPPRSAAFRWRCIRLPRRSSPSPATVGHRRSRSSVWSPVS